MSVTGKPENINEYVGVWAVANLSCLLFYQILRLGYHFFLFINWIADEANRFILHRKPCHALDVGKTKSENILWIIRDQNRVIIHRLLYLHYARFQKSYHVDDRNLLNFPNKHNHEEIFR